MKIWRRTVFSVGAVVALLGAVVLSLGGPSPTPGGSELVTEGRAAATTEVGLPDGGVIRLHLDGTRKNTNYFRLDTPDGSGGYLPGAPALITQRRCAATTSGVMTVTPGPAPYALLGFYDTGLGVGYWEGTGFLCGAVNGSHQSLTLTPSEPGTLMDFAELDLEILSTTTVRAELYRDGVLQETTTVKGKGGIPWPWEPDGDGYRMRVPALNQPATHFDTIVLSVDPSTPFGAFSLQGGGNGTPALEGGLGEALGTTDSLFHLVEVDGAASCDDEPVVIDEPGGPTVVLDRLEDTSGGCSAAIPFALRTDEEGGVLLAKPPVDPDTAFTLDVVWEPEAAIYPLSGTRIDAGAGPVLMEWCEGTPGAPIVPEGLAWCISSQSVALAGDGLVQVSETLYGAGDPRFSR